MSRFFAVLGGQAFARGEDRIVPQIILVDYGVTNAEAWYEGWDKANLAAPVFADDGTRIDVWNEQEDK